MQLISGKIPILLAFTLAMTTPISRKSWSHPHTFIDNTVTHVFDEKGHAGFSFKWVFDEFFSESIIYEYDRDKNGSFSSEEAKKVKSEAFDNLKNYNYFCDVAINGESFAVSFVENFKPSIKDNKLVYEFFAPCHVSATESFKTIRLCLYDASNFIDLTLMPEPAVEFENDVEYQVTMNSTPNPDKSWLEPEEITLKFKKKL